MHADVVCCRYPTWPALTGPESRWLQGNAHRYPSLSEPLRLDPRPARQRETGHGIRSLSEGVEALDIGSFQYPPRARGAFRVRAVCRWASAMHPASSSGVRRPSGPRKDPTFCDLSAAVQKCLRIRHHAGRRRDNGLQAGTANRVGVASQDAQARHSHPARRRLRIRLDARTARMRTICSISSTTSA